MNNDVELANEKSGLNKLFTPIWVTFAFFVGVVFTICVISDVGDISNIPHAKYLMLGSFTPFLILLIPFYKRINKRDKLLEKWRGKIE